tara:strand:+ start:579 stop:809 length:231 start_codon:yes stop_codon:yes gene_type:complete
MQRRDPPPAIHYLVKLVALGIALALVHASPHVGIDTDEKILDQYFTLARISKVLGNKRKILGHWHAVGPPFQMYLD